MLVKREMKNAAGFYNNRYLSVSLHTHCSPGILTLSQEGMVVDCLINAGRRLQNDLNNVCGHAAGLGTLVSGSEGLPTAASCSFQ